LSCQGQKGNRRRDQSLDRRQAGVLDSHGQNKLAFSLLALVALPIGVAIQDYVVRADDPGPRE
jgi:hypothetical protein